MDFEKIVKVFTIKEPFYGIILSSMNRRENKDMPTIGVGRSKGVMLMEYNPDFIKDIPLEGMIELLKHECLHICLNHITLDVDLGVTPETRNAFNIAIDIEANCYINNNISRKYIPGGAYADDFGFDKNLGAIEYYRKLLNKKKENNDGDNKKESNNPFDYHDDFPNINKFEGDDDSINELLKFEINELVMKAAEETVKSCGAIPDNIKILLEHIKVKKNPKPVCDWRKYIRKNIGNSFTDLLRKSKKRPSKRFPDAAGNRHQRKSHVLVAIDTSGSINSRDYMEFMEQIKTLSKKASFTIVECDTRINKQYEFNGTIQDVEGGGGTRFNEPIDMFLSNRKKYDKIVYMTDGGAPIPSNTPKDMLWVITSDGNKNKERYTVNGASVVFIKR